jgi:hypothetical protein
VVNFCLDQNLVYYASGQLALSKIMVFSEAFSLLRKWSIDKQIIFILVQLQL